MARLAFHGALGVLAAALATACLGGQTGEPGSLVGSCHPFTLQPTATWSSTTVESAARVFEAKHTVILHWQVEPRSASQHTTVALADTLDFEVAYAGATVTSTCSGELSVPVSVVLATSASGITESGPATLTIERLPRGLVGNLHYDGKLVKLDATLEEAFPTPTGSLDGLDPALPGASATFFEVP